MSIAFNTDHLKGFVSQADIDALLPKIKKIHQSIENKTAEGSEFTGWVDLPGRIKDAQLDELIQLGKDVRENSDCLVVIGIGGSYLGIKATIEFLGRPAKRFPVHFAGQNLSAEYMHNLLEDLKGKRVTAVVISKSGTTTEPALAFRIIKDFLSKQYKKEELSKRIICVTDEKEGALLKIAKQENYRRFIIPDDVGGRFSVLTPVGLVPLAIAGIDIKNFVDGFRKGQEEYSQNDLKKNTAHQYAAIRHLLYQKHKVIEVLSSFYDNVFYVTEWWKQLFGESEGKNDKGILPVSLSMTTDLHSLGQLMQEGMRNVFETFLMIDEVSQSVVIPADKDNLDNFNFVAGKDLDHVNKQAYQATAASHFEGGVPNMTITLCKADEFHLGQLYYLFEKAVAVSGYLSGVNPFNQPGVEAYKKKMFALLGKK